jgi:hypothetical protein
MNPISSFQAKVIILATEQRGIKDFKEKSLTMWGNKMKRAKLSTICLAFIVGISFLSCEGNNRIAEKGYKVVKEKGYRFVEVPFSKDTVFFFPQELYQTAEEIMSFFADNFNNKNILTAREQQNRLDLINKFRKLLNDEEISKALDVSSELFYQRLIDANLDPYSAGILATQGLLEIYEAIGSDIADNTFLITNQKEKDNHDELVTRIIEYDDGSGHRDMLNRITKYYPSIKLYFNYDFNRFTGVISAKVLQDIQNRNDRYVTKKYPKEVILSKTDKEKYEGKVITDPVSEEPIVVNYDGTTIAYESETFGKRTIRYVIPIAIMDGVSEMIEIKKDETEASDFSDTLITSNASEGLNSIDSEGFTRTIELQTKKMNGPDIVKIQNRLLSLGFSEIGEADGYYGQLSEGTIKSVQKYLGFNQNGKVDRLLWSTIFNDNNTEVLKNIAIIVKYKVETMVEEEGLYGTRIYKHDTEKKVVNVYFGGDGIYSYLDCYFIGNNYFFVVDKEIRYDETTEKVYLYDENKTYEITNGTFSPTNFDFGIIFVRID